MNTQNMNFDLSFTNYPSLFIQFLALLTAGYLIYEATEYFKSTKKDESPSFNFDFLLLISLYQKLFVIGGIGFIISDFLSHAMKVGTNRGGMSSLIDGPLNAMGWSNFGFGIILIFLGIALRSFRKGVK